MKALSIKQPYAELIVNGQKKIEIRKWNTKLRGEFLIHASKSADKGAMKRFGFKELPLGRIVGKAFLKDVKKYEDKSDFANDKNLHLANSTYGNYGFILENVKRVKEIECKGALNFWEFDKDGI